MTDPRVAVLIPRRADHGRRDVVWRWVREWWARTLPDWHVIEGDHDDGGRFNRCAAINRAADHDEARAADVLVIADADSIAGPAQLAEAVEGSLSSGVEFWLGYDRFCYLSRRMSDRIMGGYLGAWEPGVEWWLPGTCSSAVVVTRRLFDEIGGFDEAFVGWGFEDVAFSHAAQTFGGGLQRAAGPVWHLWHPPSTENDHTSPEWQANLVRSNLYAAAAYDRARMREVLDGNVAA